MTEKKKLLNCCGLPGIAAFLSYTAAVVFSSIAYPGYNWMARAVSDLSASNAPFLRLWNQLSSLYNVCTLVCAMMVCIGIQGKGQELPFLWSFRSNCAWNDDGRSHGDEHCSERLFWNRGEILCICGNRI